MSKLKNLPSIVCITTTQSSDRLNNFLNQCNLYNITNYSIYTFKPYNECNYIITGEFIDKIETNSKGPVTSHIKALFTWYHSSDEEYVLVLEDDVDLKTVEFWSFSWQDFFDFLPYDWECVQLCCIRKSFDENKMHFRRRINYDWGCQAYLVKRTYIKKIIDKYYTNPNIFNLDISNIEVYFDEDESSIYSLFPTVENVLFEGLGKVYNFPLFTEDIQNTNSNFCDYSSSSSDDPHIYSYFYITNWWKHQGQYLALNNIFNKHKVINIIYIKDDFDFEEHDYLMSLLPQDCQVNVEKYFDEELLNINLNCDILIYRIFGMYPEKFSRVLKNIKPKIMINLADEFYHVNNNAFNLLGAYSQLYLRNYHHKNYTYPPNTMHIPLGHCIGVKLSQNKPIKKIHEKTYNWSWAGNIKRDRQEMIDQFKNIDQHFVSNNLSRSEVANLYNDSIFVPCGRGNFTLDCWRLYESSSCGAIPVVVGDMEEISETFKYEENPPWIFANTWEEARITCENLLNNKPLLQTIQDNLLLWWDNRINTIRKKINETLNTSRISNINI